MLCCISLMTSLAFASLTPREKTSEPEGLLVPLEVPLADVLKAVDGVTQDQIVHGTYTYEKERILYGAHSADSARAFGPWKGPGQAFYKVATNVLAPRNFKDSGDIGTISVRYVVQQGEDSRSALLQIEAVFVDARGVRHRSLGDVEQGEYGAIMGRLQKLQADRIAQSKKSAATSAQATQAAAPSTHVMALAAQPSTSAPPPGPDTSATPVTLPEMQKRVEALRHQVELRVKADGAQLKAAPFHSASTLQSLPAETEVLIVILSPYWYGVETQDGHHGWIHHSQLEPLP